MFFIFLFVFILKSSRHIFSLQSSFQRLRARLVLPWSLPKFLTDLALKTVKLISPTQRICFCGSHNKQLLFVQNCTLCEVRTKSYV
jgi:hypothetical protein